MPSVRRERIGFLSHIDNSSKWATTSAESSSTRLILLKAESTIIFRHLENIFDLYLSCDRSGLCINGQVAQDGDRAIDFDSRFSTKVYISLF